ISGDAYRQAIRAKGVQVDANIRGFEAGLAAAARGTAPAAPAPPATAPSPDVARMAESFPAPLHPILHPALCRLIDYQGRAYAERYLQQLRPFVQRGDLELARIVARHLAVWMSYEDAVRVAQLKTRASRFERIAREKGADGGGMGGAEDDGGGGARERRPQDGGEPLRADRAGEGRRRRRDRRDRFSQAGPGRDLRRPALPARAARGPRGGAPAGR